MNIVNGAVGIHLIAAPALAMLYAIVDPLVWDIKTQGYSPVCIERTRCLPPASCYCAGRDE